MTDEVYRRWAQSLSQTRRSQVRTQHWGIIKSLARRRYQSISHDGLAPSDLDPDSIDGTRYRACLEHVHTELASGELRRRVTTAIDQFLIEPAPLRMLADDLRPGAERDFTERFSKRTDTIVGHALSSRQEDDTAIASRVREVALDVAARVCLRAWVQDVADRPTENARWIDRIHRAWSLPEHVATRRRWSEWCAETPQAPLPLSGRGYESILGRVSRFADPPAASSRRRTPRDRSEFEELLLAEIERSSMPLRLATEPARRRILLGKAVFDAHGLTVRDHPNPCPQGGAVQCFELRLRSLSCADGETISSDIGYLSQLATTAIGHDLSGEEWLALPVTVAHNVATPYVMQLQYFTAAISPVELLSCTRGIQNLHAFSRRLAETLAQRLVRPWGDVLASILAVAANKLADETLRREQFGSDITAALPQIIVALTALTKLAARQTNATDLTRPPRSRPYAPSPEGDEATDTDDELHPRVLDVIARHPNVRRLILLELDMMRRRAVQRLDSRRGGLTTPRPIPSPTSSGEQGRVVSMLDFLRWVEQAEHQGRDLIIDAGQKPWSLVHLHVYELRAQGDSARRRYPELPDRRTYVGRTPDAVRKATTRVREFQDISSVLKELESRMRSHG